MRLILTYASTLSIPYCPASRPKMGGPHGPWLRPFSVGDELANPDSDRAGAGPSNSVMTFPIVRGMCPHLGQGWSGSGGGSPALSNMTRGCFLQSGHETATALSSARRRIFKLTRHLAVRAPLLVGLDVRSDPPLAVCRASDRAVPSPLTTHRLWPVRPEP